MPDFSALTALDIAIGLFFLYFVLSIVCSTLSELIAAALGWRARNLELAIQNLLEDPAKIEAFWDNPRIRALSQPVQKRFWGKRKAAPANADATTVAEAPAAEAPAAELEPTGAEAIPGGAPVSEPPPAPAVRRPSYVPPRAFALTALDTLAPDLAARAREADARAGGAQVVADQMLAMLDDIPSEGVRVALKDAIDEGRTSIDQLRRAVEEHFDLVMDRASGWYKRKSQLALLLIATAVTIAGNVDTVQVASKLWKDDALRASVVQQATAETEAGQPQGEADLEQLSDDVDQVTELGLPLGWQASGFPETVGGWFAKVLLGWPATILALSMGSAFWFDVLGKIARLRVAGKPEGTVKDDSGNKGHTTGTPA
jgi:hypothetical protein